MFSNFLLKYLKQYNHTILTVIYLNREQYLRARIAEIAEELTGKKIPPVQRRNLERALKFYIDDLRNNQ